MRIKSIAAFEDSLEDARRCLKQKTITKKCGEVMGAYKY